MTEVEYRPLSLVRGHECLCCTNRATQEAIQSRGNLTAIIRCCNDPKCICRAQEILRTQGMDSYQWRRERDSNPRYGFPYSGFQDRLFQPLTHPSAAYKQLNIIYLLQCAIALLPCHCTYIAQSVDSSPQRWIDGAIPTRIRLRGVERFPCSLLEHGTAEG